MAEGGHLPESILACLKESEADDDATIDFIREAALSSDGSTEERLEELGDLLEPFGARELAQSMLEWVEQLQAAKAEAETASKPASADAAALVQELIAADAAQLEAAKAAAASEVPDKSQAEDFDKAAVLRAVRTRDSGCKFDQFGCLHHSSRHGQVQRGGGRTKTKSLLAFGKKFPVGATHAPPCLGSTSFETL